jgi:hypothetical protein
MKTENTEALASIATGEDCAMQLEFLELNASELEELAHRLDHIETGSSAEDRRLHLYAAHLIGEAKHMKRWAAIDRANGRREDDLVYKNFVVATRPTSIAADLIADIDRYEDELDAIGREVLERPDVRGLNAALRKKFLVQAIWERFGAEKLIAKKADEIMLQSLILGMAIDIGDGRVKENPEYDSIRENGHET